MHNLLSNIAGLPAKAQYDGYASCPLLTGHNELMLCEFKYGGVPTETFEWLFGGQEKPRRAFYHLKKDFFVSRHNASVLQTFANIVLLFSQPYIYWSSFLDGTWYGPKAFTQPKYE